MKAADRCRQNSQGDRCRLAAGHEGPHEGQFTFWNDLSRIEKVQNITPRLHRKEKAALRNLKWMQDGPQKKKFLEHILKRLGATT